MNGKERTEETLLNVANYLSKILDKGYMFTELRRMIYVSWLKGCNGIIKAECSNLNILKSEVHYHKNLRLRPAPPVVEVDYNTGEMVSHESEYFVEMVASYTIQDIVDYVYSLKLVNKTVYNENRLAGLIKYYLNKYDIEILLFMIEAAVDYREDINDTIQFEKLDNYYPKAVEYVQTITNNCHSSGGDKICPRKRF